MLVREAVLETVRSIAFLAMHTSDQRSVNQRLAARIGALLLVGQDVGFGGQWDVAFWSLVRGGAVAGPFACFGALVGCFGAVVEAELARRCVSEVALGRL